MASPTFRTSAVRQVLRRIYPHKAMQYARQHLRGLALGPVTLADAADLVESFIYSLIPREAQGVVRFLLGLNTELCQAGPVEKPRPANRLRTASRPRPGKPMKRKPLKA
jgi:hypothetical protein